MKNRVDLFAAAAFVLPVSLGMGLLYLVLSGKIEAMPVALCIISFGLLVLFFFNLGSEKRRERKREQLETHDFTPTFAAPPEAFNEPGSIDTLTSLAPRRKAE